MSAGVNKEGAARLLGCTEPSVLGTRASQVSRLSANTRLLPIAACRQLHSGNLPVMDTSRAGQTTQSVCLGRQNFCAACPIAPDVLDQAFTRFIQKSDSLEMLNRCFSKASNPASKRRFPLGHYPQGQSSRNASTASHRHLCSNHTESFLSLSEWSTRRCLSRVQPQNV